MNTSLERPSSLCDGDPSGLLKEIENRSPHVVYNGSSPRSWVAAAEYVDGYIKQRVEGVVPVEQEHGIHRQTVYELYPRLIRTDAFDRYYGSVLNPAGSLGRFLARRRATREILGVCLTESEKSIRRRLSAVKRHDEKHELLTEERAGKLFYYTQSI